MGIRKRKKAGFINVFQAKAKSKSPKKKSKKAKKSQLAGGGLAKTQARPKKGPASETGRVPACPGPRAVPPYR